MQSSVRNYVKECYDLIRTKKKLERISVNRSLSFTS